MEDIIKTYAVPLFFTHITVAVLFLAWWFIKKGSVQSPVFRHFAWGLTGYGLGLAAWSLVAVIKPDNMSPLIIAGVIPFLLGNVAFTQATLKGRAKLKSPQMILTLLLIIATFASRTFFYESEPYFSDEGLLYFGLQSLPVALYIATIATSFLPAIWAVVAEIKNQTNRVIMGIGLNTFFINAVIIVSSSDHDLLLINGAVITATAIMLWGRIIQVWKKKGI